MALSLGVLITATYSIRTIKQLYTGPMRLDMQQVEDLRPLEWIAAGTLIVGMLVLGFYPAPLLDLITLAAEPFVAAVTLHAPAISGGAMP